MKNLFKKELVLFIVLTGFILITLGSVNVEASKQGPYIKDGSYVQITKKNYSMWKNFDWKKKNNTSNVYQKTYQARGRYKHDNGSTYYSLYDSKGIWQGYLNADATKKVNKQGNYISDGSYVQVTKNNYELWQNFNWQKKDMTNTIYNRTLQARGKYNHYNGATYYSLYDSKGTWYGYVNAGAVKKTVAQGEYIKDGNYVTAKSKNYDLWQNFKWQSKGKSSSVFGTTLQARGRYEHYNGATYYSLYDSKGTWYGYMNATGLEKTSAQGKYKQDIGWAQVINRGYPIYQNFNWKVKDNTDNCYGGVFQVKGRYDHFNGETYYSIYSIHDNSWYGYVNGKAVLFYSEEQYELDNLKAIALNNLQHMNLNEERSNYEKKISNAKSVDELNQIMAEALEVSNANDKKDKEEADKVKALEESKKNTLNELNSLNLGDEKSNFELRINQAKTIQEVNEILQEARNLSEENNNKPKPSENPLLATVVKSDNKMAQQAKNDINNDISISNDVAQELTNATLTKRVKESFRQKLNQERAKQGKKGLIISSDLNEIEYAHVRAVTVMYNGFNHGAPSGNPSDGKTTGPDYKEGDPLFIGYENISYTQAFMASFLSDEQMIDTISTAMFRQYIEEERNAALGKPLQPGDSQNPGHYQNLVLGDDEVLSVGVYVVENNSYYEFTTYASAGSDGKYIEW